MCSWIAAELVGKELPRWLPLMLQHLQKEAFRGFAISPPRHQNIDHIAILIDRSPQIMASTPDRNEQFVDEPDVTCLPLLSS